ncbi:uncharacterized protein LOC135691031 [Rhopilema esculentum]|uniref:uncharacterized protein LOC135691031 n=1 Tax=Rhopilema esculentum TaxID=499914 RepID=UPI0031D76C8E
MQLKNSGMMAERFSDVKKKKPSLGRECAAFGCSNTFYNSDGVSTGIHFFKFPQKNPEKRLWCNLIKRIDGMDDFRVTDATCLCEEHFKDEDIKRNPSRWRLNHDAVPSRNLYAQPAQRPARKVPFDRTSTSFTFPCEFLPSTDILEDSSNNEANDHSAVLPERDYARGVVDDEQFLSLLSDHTSLKQKVSELQAQVQSLTHLTTELKKKFFSLEKLQSDDSAVKFYTGFPDYSCLVAVFDYLHPKLERMSYWRGSKSSESTQESNANVSRPGRKRKLFFLEEFVFVLMRLKVGLFLADLADRFCISKGHASKIFTTWINFLAKELPLLFPFPSKQKTQQLMPREFGMYPSTKIILDCTEIFTEVPSSMVAQSQTWSEYKHHNTWKSLIGVSPNGAIIFVSKLWSGKVSDREITLKSGVLSLLEPGDNIMADRGFNIFDILPCGVSLNIPPFKGSRSQLTPQEAEETANIAAVRIHVERAIGRVKNYHILDGVLPLSLYPVANQIFTVCCYLTNFLPFLVKPANNED